MSIYYQQKYLKYKDKYLLQKQINETSKKNDNSQPYDPNVVPKKLSLSDSNIPTTYSPKRWGIKKYENPYLSGVMDISDDNLLNLIRSKFYTVDKLFIDVNNVDALVQATYADILNIYVWAFDRYTSLALNNKDDRIVNEFQQKITNFKIPRKSLHKVHGIDVSNKRLLLLEKVDYYYNKRDIANIFVKLIATYSSKPGFDLDKIQCIFSKIYDHYFIEKSPLNIKYSNLALYSPNIEAYYKADEIRQQLNMHVNEPHVTISQPCKTAQSNNPEKIFIDTISTFFLWAYLLVKNKFNCDKLLYPIELGPYIKLKNETNSRSVGLIIENMTTELDRLLDIHDIKYCKPNLEGAHIKVRDRLKNDQNRIVNYWDLNEKDLFEVLMLPAYSID